MLPRRPVHSDFSIPSTISPDSGRGIFHTRGMVTLHKTEAYFLHLLSKKYFKNPLTFSACCGIIIKSSGSTTPERHLGVAQLVARYLGVVEAASSSLVTQTKKEIRKNLLFSLFFAQNRPFSRILLRKLSQTPSQI